MGNRKGVMYDSKQFFDGGASLTIMFVNIDLNKYF